MSEDRSIEITHQSSDIDFNIYYTYDEENKFIDITGIYLYGNQVDLVEVIDECIIDDIRIEIEYKVGM